MSVSAAGLRPMRLRDLRRVRRIASVLARHGFHDVAARLRVLPFVQRIVHLFRREAASPAQLTVEERIRRAIEELGPTFIKLGQMLATRPDLVPMSLVIELRKLQDRVPAFVFDAVRLVVEKDLHQSIDACFERFEPEPIAAASIAQVHEATLRGGEEVVVKVQRPGLDAMIHADLRILTSLAQMLEDRVPELRPFRPLAIVQEFRRSLSREIDFCQELQSMQRFAEHFRDEPGIHVPVPHPQLCSRRVLVMERVRGVKITDREGMAALAVDPARVVEVGMRVTLRSIFEFGFFHADPHPGNFFIREDGSIALLDFGMMGTVESRRIDELLGFMVAMMNGDLDHLVQLMLDADLIGDDTDMRAMRAELGRILGRYQHVALGSLDVSGLLSEVLEVVMRHHVMLPADLVLAGKAIGTMEGIGEEVLPDFRPLDAVKPYLTELYVRRVLDPRKHSQTLVRSLTDGLALLKDSPLDLRRVLRKLRRGELTLVLKSQEAEAENVGRSRRANRIILGFLFPTFFFASVFLIESDSLFQKGAGVLSFGLSFVFLGGLLWSMLKSDGR